MGTREGLLTTTDRGGHRRLMVFARVSIRALEADLGTDAHVCGDGSQLGHGGAMNLYDELR